MSTESTKDARLEGLAVTTERLGIDFAVVYPTYELPVMSLGGPELRCALAHSVNRYYAEVYDGLVTPGCGEQLDLAGMRGGDSSAGSAVRDVESLLGYELVIGGKGALVRRSGGCDGRACNTATWSP